METSAAIIQRKLPSVRQLRAFHAIAQTQNVSVAAATIRLSQPALSQSLRKLELLIGAQLFTRQATGAYLTPAGHTLLKRVERLRSRIEPLFAEAKGGVPATDAADNRLWRLTLPQMRSIIAVADCGSFAQAARRLEISEPSVHHSARDLEALLGRPLYQRTPDGMALTRQGTEAARQLRLALRELDQAFDELAEPSGAGHGRLTVGALPLTRTLILPRAVNRLGALYPAASVHLVDGPYEVLLSDLRGGSLDILIGALRNPAPADDVIEEEMLRDGFAVVVRAGHPLTRLASPGVDDLAACDWIIARRGTPIRAAFDQLFAERPAPPVARVETSSLVMIRGLLVESDKVTILSRRQILFEEEQGLLTALSFPLRAGERAIGASVRANWLPTRLQADFMQILREECRRSAAPDETSKTQLRRLG